MATSTRRSTATMEVLDAKRRLSEYLDRIALSRRMSLGGESRTSVHELSKQRGLFIPPIQVGSLVAGDVASMKSAPQILAPAATTVSQLIRLWKNEPESIALISLTIVSFLTYVVGISTTHWVSERDYNEGLWSFCLEQRSGEMKCFGIPADGVRMPLKASRVFIIIGQIFNTLLLASIASYMWFNSTYALNTTKYFTVGLILFELLAVVLYASGIYSLDRKLSHLGFSFYLIITSLCLLFIIVGLTFNAQKLLHKRTRIKKKHVGGGGGFREKDRFHERQRRSFFNKEDRRRSTVLAREKLAANT